MKTTCPNMYTNTSHLWNERQENYICSEDAKCQNLSGKWNKGGVSSSHNPGVRLMLFYLDPRAAKKGN